MVPRPVLVAVAAAARVAQTSLVARLAEGGEVLEVVRVVAVGSLAEISLLALSRHRTTTSVRLQVGEWSTIVLLLWTQTSLPVGAPVRLTMLPTGA
jgi:hypothetical protein